MYFWGGIVLIIYVFFVQPIMAKNKAIYRATKRVEQVLGYWETGDSASGRLIWEDPTKFPIIYGLGSHKINSVLTKRERNVFYTKVYVILNFSSDGIHPSSRKVVFEIKQDGLKCIVLDMHTTNDL